MDAQAVLLEWRARLSQEASRQEGLLLKLREGGSLDLSVWEAEVAHTKGELRSVDLRLTELFTCPTHAVVEVPVAHHRPQGLLPGWGWIWLSVGLTILVLIGLWIVRQLARAFRELVQHRRRLDRLGRVPRAGQDVDVSTTHESD